MKGIIVPGCGNRRGRRADEAVDHEVERRGGEFRPLGQMAEEKVLHEDAASWVREKRAKRLRTCNLSQQS